MKCFLCIYKELICIEGEEINKEIQILIYVFLFRWLYEDLFFLRSLFIIFFIEYIFFCIYFRFMQ